jgi:hypothetical protein
MERMSANHEHGTKFDSPSPRREDDDYPVGGQIAVCLWVIAVFLALFELTWWFSNCIVS